MIEPYLLAFPLLSPTGSCAKRRFATVYSFFSLALSPIFSVSLCINSLYSSLLVTAIISFHPAAPVLLRQQLPREGGYYSLMLRQYYQHAGAPFTL